MAEGKHARIDNEEQVLGQTKSKSSSLGGFIATVIAIIVLAFALRSFVFQPYEIPSSSMETTIMTGDILFAEKVSYCFSEPEQGDIVTFTEPELLTANGSLESDDSRTLIKRVIAVGGQQVDLRNGVVYVDGVALDEPYTGGKPSYPLGATTVTYPYTVPDGCIWVMGDNRTNSKDSRYFGAIPVDSVTGRAVFIYWPLSSIGVIE